MVVTDSVLLNGVIVGEGAVVQNAIVDKGVVIPPGAELGVDLEADAARGLGGMRLVSPAQTVRVAATAWALV